MKLELRNNAMTNVLIILRLKSQHFANSLAIFPLKNTNSWLSKVERQVWARQKCTFMRFVCSFYKNNVSSSVVSMHRMTA